MNFIPTPIPGAFIVEAARQEDERGYFLKNFQASVFERAGIPFRPQECFHSLSRRDVLRGMHFQMPPRPLKKLVFCMKGALLDVVVDLRKGSPAFSQAHAVELTADNDRALYIPEGCAHGFLTLSEEALTFYYQEGEYEAECDTGVLWNSIPFRWPVGQPVVSPRDRAFPALKDFNSPF